MLEDSLYPGAIPIDHRRASSQIFFHPELFRPLRIDYLTALLANANRFTRWG